MTSRFRNELTVVPPVRIRVSGRGLATTINWDEEGVDQSLDESRTALRTIGDPRFSGPLPTDPYLIPGTRIYFGGGDIAAMTSPGLNDFKALLIATHERERQIRDDAASAKLQLALTRVGRALAWATLIPAVSKTVRTKLDTSVALRRNEVSTLQHNLATSRVSVSFDMETAVADPHRRMLAAFDQLSGSEGAWSVQTAQQIDRVKARSTARTVVGRIRARLGRGTDPLIDTNDLPPELAIQNGQALAYFYPGFVLVVNTAKSDFAMIDLTELEVSYNRFHFTETEAMPRDTAVVNMVWAKSNKNGTRDMRFKDNQQLPVMLYGSVGLSGPGGLNEVFMFSRNDACENFVSAVNELQTILASGRFNQIS